MAYKRLGDLLVSVGLITEDQLGEALKVSKSEGKRLGAVLIDTHVITEMQLIDVLKIQLGVEFVDLSKVEIPVALANLVPKNIARKYTVVPVRADVSSRMSAIPVSLPEFTSSAMRSASVSGLTM